MTLLDQALTPSNLLNLKKIKISNWKHKKSSCNEEIERIVEELTREREGKVRIEEKEKKWKKKRKVYGHVEV